MMDNKAYGSIEEQNESKSLDVEEEVIGGSATSTHKLDFPKRGLIFIFMVLVIVVGYASNSEFRTSIFGINIFATDAQDPSTTTQSNGVNDLKAYGSSIPINSPNVEGDEEEEEAADDDAQGLFVQGGDDLGKNTSDTNGIFIIQPQSNEMMFKLSRSGYSPVEIDDRVFYYRFLADVDTIIEPHTTTTLWVGDASSSVYYEYTVCSLDTGDCIEASAGIDSTYTTDFSVGCTPFTVYSVNVKEYSIASGQETRSAIGTAMCIYVRREIRGLTQTDLSSLMDAMYVMWSVSEEDGVELYGEDYHDSSYLLEFHHFNAAWQDADHIHEGNGFVTQHIKMTNIFEKSVQAVDPSLTIPYWDFTIDDASGKGAHNSVIMSSLLFGSMTDPVDLTSGYTYESDSILGAAIPDGRWAYIKADKNTKFDDLKAGYGYMRAPWNMNPSPYISRFTMDLQIGISLPTCTSHYKMLEETNMMDFMYDMQNDPHATTHSLSGGIYGCDVLMPLLDEGYISDETNLKSICSKWIFYLKEFYRYNYIVPNSNCTVPDDLQTAICGFSCVESTMTPLLTNLFAKIANNIPSDISVAGQEAWKAFLCEGDGQKIFSGDHLESASPADPSFWVIHPTLERLMHAKFMGGGFDNETWATDAVDTCEKAMCSSSDYAAMDYFDDCCYGHYENDRVFDFINGNRSTHVGDTNGEILAATDPRSREYSMPYIYDAFSWTHCKDDFTGLLESMAISRRKLKSSADAQN